MDRERYTAANREAWDEAAPLHREQNTARLLRAVRSPGFSCLDEVETRVLQRIGVAGKRVAQLGCNNGRELLSVCNLGAVGCVGFDGAQGFVDQARELQQACGRDCTFVCADVYSIPRGFDAAFDLVTVTIGVLAWMPDLPGFMRAATRLLRSGGRLFVYEQHPVLDMVAPGGADAPVCFEHSYFETEPLVETGGLDYYGGGRYDSLPLYSFHHKLSDVFAAALGAGLRLEHFEELPGHISNTWYNVEKQGPRLPMSYTLVLVRD